LRAEGGRRPEHHPAALAHRVSRQSVVPLLPATERVPGPEHPDTLATRGNLAHWTQQSENDTGLA